MTSCEDYLTTNSSVNVSDNIILNNVTNLSYVNTSNYQLLLFAYNSTFDFRGVYKGIVGNSMISEMRGNDVLCASNMGGEQLTAYKYLAEGTSSSGESNNMWYNMYNVINSANLILSNIDDASGDQSSKNSIKGQALAMRAIAYFELIQHYQQTYMLAKNKPGLILRTSSNDPYNMPRVSTEAIYTQIVSDLTEAETLLAGFSRGSETYLINADVVNGMQARVFLVMNEWSKAFAAAQKVYAKYNTLMTKEQWHNFCECYNYPETIWAVRQTSENNYGSTGQYNFWYNWPDANCPYFKNDTRLWRSEGVPVDCPYYQYYNFCTNEEYVKLFEETEDRYLFWKRDIESNEHWAFGKMLDKATDGAHAYGDYAIMRGSEMLLIMAEAKANLNETAEALGYLNTLQEARNASATQTADKAALLESIYVERRKELLGEGVTGHLDLLRLQKPLQRTGNHFSWGVANVSYLPSNDYRFIFQIPEAEFNLNAALTPADQNPFEGVN